MGFRRILILGLLIVCVLVTLPAVNAATVVYNVSTYCDLENVSYIIRDNPGMDVIINLKSDISYTDLVLNNDTSPNVRFPHANLVINGNNHSIKINPTNVLMAPALTARNAMNFENVTCVFNNVRFVGLDSVSDNTRRINGIYIHGLSNVTFNSCVFDNNVYNGNDFSFIYLDDCLPDGYGSFFIENRSGTESLKFNNCVVSNNVGSFLKIGQLNDNRTLNFEMVNMTFSNNVLSSNSFVALKGDDVKIENCDIIGNNVSIFFDVTNNVLISNVSFENNSVTDNLVRFGSPGVVLKNCYFGNNSGVLFYFLGTSASFSSGMSYEIVHNTFYNNSVSALVKAAINPSPKTEFYFNTFVNNSNFSSTGNFSNFSFFGNLNVNSSNNVDTSELVSSYSEVFGTNSLGLNGGKTKNIQLSDKDTNPALNKISSVEYQAKIGSNPDSGVDQAGKKRLYGSAVDYGSVELQKGVIGSIIDDIINIIKPSKPSDGDSDDSDGSKLFSKTKPSMVEFLSGDGSLITRMSNLLYFIVSNWVKLGVPVISPMSQGIINIAGWES